MKVDANPAPRACPTLAKPDRRTALATPDRPTAGPLVRLPTASLRNRIRVAVARVYPLDEAAEDVRWKNRPGPGVT